MKLDKIKTMTKEGDYNVIIEIPMNDNPVKYEFDKDAQCIMVDRFMQVAMSYPCNYGFIPHTLSDDGDPADVLVMSAWPIIPSAVIKVRPVGVLMMEDEAGFDEKILAVPTSKLDSTYDNIKDISDVPEMMKNRIKHFFEHCKDLDAGKWVKIKSWEGAKKAKDVISEAISRAKK